MNGLSLCAGIGAIDLGLRLALGDAYRTVGYVEREAYAAAVLVARMADKVLDTAPIWDDLTTFDGRAYRGRVDLISAGLPCQPYSLAGKRTGHADERALWPEFVRIVREVEPSLVFLENVPTFLRHFEPVWRELRGMGFEFAPPLLHTASESGAPHIRKRVFILAAHPERIDLRHESRRGGWPCCGSEARAGHVGESASDTDRSGLEEWGIEHHSQLPPIRGSGNEATDTDRERREGEWGGWVFDAERETLWHDTDRCGRGCRICGTPWATESPVLRVDDGPANRTDRLRCLGNGVVPTVAASAFVTALRELRDR